MSFQFDTTFMYTIAILIYVKLYQNRHPDSSAGSIKAYLILGAAIALEAISIYFGNSAFFWAIFCIIYILSMVCVVANIYKLDSKKRMKKEKKHWLDSILFFRVYRLENNFLNKLIGFNLPASKMVVAKCPKLI